MEFHVRVESDSLPLGVGRAVCRNDLIIGGRTRPQCEGSQSSARHTRHAEVRGRPRLRLAVLALVRVRPKPGGAR